jgi:hypothetical protein
LPALAVALIGSFKQHYKEVLEAARTFREAGWEITSPKCSPVTSGGDFVRFETDDSSHSDAHIQSVTLANIFTADLVYVVNPGGYVGRTTCYEIGRVVQKKQPIFFLEEPRDLPVEIAQWAIQSPTSLVEYSRNPENVRWLFKDGVTKSAEIERDL